MTEESLTVASEDTAAEDVCVIAAITEDLSEDFTEDIEACEEDTDNAEEIPACIEETAEASDAENLELIGLRAEIESLRAELARKESENERVLAEIGEFAGLFPEIAIKSIPEEVWSRVREGVPLAASYALYEKKTQMHAAITKAVNEKNAERTSGAVSNDGGNIYYSPSEVRTMSKEDVRKNYNKIIESMKKWN